MGIVMPPSPSVSALLVLVLPAPPKNRRAIDRGINAKSRAAHCRLITAISCADDSFSALPGETVGNVVISGAPLLPVVFACILAKEPESFPSAEGDVEEGPAGEAGI